jgi:hypothetical protein
MGGFRCRLGWCLSPGAVFKTAAPHSVFFMVVVVSVMLVCGLRLPRLLASSFWFWSGVCCEALVALVWLLWRVAWPAAFCWWAGVSVSSFAVLVMKGIAGRTWC